MCEYVCESRHGKVEKAKERKGFTTHREKKRDRTRAEYKNTHIDHSVIGLTGVKKKKKNKNNKKYPLFPASSNCTISYLCEFFYESSNFPIGRTLYHSQDVNMEKVFHLYELVYD